VISHGKQTSIDTGRTCLRSTIRISLKGARADADASQRELAEKLEWTRNQIANLENGRREVTLIDFIMIAHALRVDPYRLLRRILQW
jgi:transcriptional regulator with XRE-family HTH domain